jgi:aminopeptidase N
VIFLTLVFFSLPCAQVEIHHTSEIGGIFDDIIYIKGASIVGMLQSYLGAERFQVSNFLLSLLKY